MIEPGTIVQLAGWMLGAGTVGGIASGELTRRMAARENRKKQLGCLLSDLLELRHRFIGIRETAKATAPLLPGQEDQVTLAAPASFEGLMSDPKLHERYESAVSDLAALDPMLAYQLRSKNLALAMLGPISKAALQNSATMPIAAKALKIYGDVVTSALDDAILRVAKELSRKVHLKVRTMLNTKPEMPEPVSQFFALIPQMIQAEQHAKANTESAEPPQPNNPGSVQTAKGSGLGTGLSECYASAVRRDRS